uniref:Zinc finger protein 414 n=1 Tax=Aquila chrysaetos chrysaetos TaxID=223781 RepID=A0A663FGP9_AQUCH
MKTEKDEAVPTFSLGGKYAGEGAGCSEAALPGGPMPVAGSGGTPAPDLRPLKRRPVPGKHYQCSSYGCKLAFPSMQELMDHLKVHYRPTQSLEGKTFHCPTLGCTETFPSMQDLMAHMKVHYKPNRYFKCENCMLRFRTHRSLFKHLHVCSDSASNPAPPPKADKPVLPATSALEKEPPAKPPEGLPKLPSVIRPPEKEAILPGADTAPAAPAALPTSLPELPGSLEALPLVSPAPHPFPLLEPSLFGPSSLTRFSGPPPSSVPGPFLSYVHPSPYSLPQPPAQHRLRPYVPGHGPPHLQRRLEEKPRALLQQPHRVGAHAGPLHLHAVSLLHRLAGGDDPAHRGPPQEPPATRAPGHRDGFRGGPRLLPRQADAGDGELPVLPALMPPAPTELLLHLPIPLPSPQPGRGALHSPMPLRWDRDPFWVPGASPSTGWQRGGWVFFSLEFLPSLLFLETLSTRNPVSPSPKGFIASAPGALEGAR